MVDPFDRARLELSTSTGDGPTRHEGLVTALALATGWWPDRDWSAATTHHGAFHAVLVLPGQVVARVSKRLDPRGRVAAEHRLLSLLAAAGRWALPAPLGVPRSSPDGHAGMLVTWVSGVHREDAPWPDVAGELGTLLAALAAGQVIAASGELPPARAWCGGPDLPELVRTTLAPLLPVEARGPAADAVAAVLEEERGAVPVHGDLGPHNILWTADGRIAALVDLDHAAVGDPAIDVAPLLGRFGATALSAVVEAEVLRRAMVHRATLSLQVAAAAELAGDCGLRDFALRNFAARLASGTLHDPGGCTP
jgi:aminoglycoside phosphotransferase (APT) family kinase protein